MKKTMMLFLLVILAACSGEKPQQLFETAQFEEKQNNREHAAQLYREVMKKAPGTDLARQAEERLAQLEKGK